MTSSPSTSPPLTPPRTSSPSAHLSDEEHEALELARIMRSPSPNIEGLSTTNATLQPDVWLTSSLRVESDRARRLAVTRKLHPYQRDLMDEFIRVSGHVIELVAKAYSQFAAL